MLKTVPEAQAAAVTLLAGSKLPGTYVCSFLRTKTISVLVELFDTTE